MGNTVWNTPEEAMAIMAGQFELLRALAVELHELGRLDDELLARVEQEAVKKAKGTTFNPEAADELQIWLMDFSISAIRDMSQYIKTNRDNGNFG
jgi:hypothetical protein